MSWLKVQARVCPVCGHDSAKIVPGAAARVFVVSCGADGCEAVGQPRLTDCEAVFAWNEYPPVSVVDLARGIL